MQRIAVSTLIPTAEILQSSVDELLYNKATKENDKPGPASKLQRQVEQVHQLPRTKQQFVMDMLDTVIQKEAH